MTEHIRYAVMRNVPRGKAITIARVGDISITPNKGSVGYIDVFRTRADAEDMAKFYEPTGGATILEMTLTGKETE